jgi:hypothetical protein
MLSLSHCQSHMLTYYGLCLASEADADEWGSDYWSCEFDTGLKIAACVLSAYGGLFLLVYFLIWLVMYCRARLAARRLSAEIKLPLAARTLSAETKLPPRLLDSPLMQKGTQEDETESDLSEWHVSIDEHTHNNARNDCSER